MMKKILFATDFSENAAAALVFAIKMAQKHHASLVMLHIFDVPTSWNYPYTDDPIEMEREALKDSLSKLKAYFQEYAKDDSVGLEVSYHARENLSHVKGIVSFALEQEPQLIVIGTRGGSMAKEIIVGGTAKSLIPRSPAPVLAVPEVAIFREVKNVLYLTDFHEMDVEAIRKLIEILAPYDPEISITHVNTYLIDSGHEKKEWFENLVKENLPAKKIHFHQILADNIYDGINSYLNDNRLDMLVMLEKRRESFLDKIFHKDLVKRMDFHTTMPLLSFNEHYLRGLP
ncbi:hypothetical protein P872_18950 [Rhodonellum psychrophilum GCM71 = DSM 17998]|uniref:UspA domain-containing protein n=2 Tax=Rhodonellum TaxID=336827 RepID=U5BWL4_9BACT|nr:MULTISPECIES: universal stress protein [Rhodonellum]ERM82263.1 hypothetical protein P872_18950 [Rhodonellum psychrophilum GCM71 = DSM 17998]SDZ25672.1 Nucleotide-binding universal stress protein, UspA family [Rhodonellum ikkaensis]